jgi:hypothetical protein
MAYLPTIFFIGSGPLFIIGDIRQIRSRGIKDNDREIVSMLTKRKKDE